MSVTVLLAALVLSGGDPTTVVPPADSIVRIYNLRSVTPNYDSGDGLEQSLLLPPSDRWWDLPRANFGELYETASSEVVVDLLGQILGDELRYEGREINLTGDSDLIVLAPEELHAKLAAALSMLEEVVAASVEVGVDILELPTGVDMPAGGIVDESEAQRVLAQLAGRGAAHQSYTLRLSAGRTSRVDEMQPVPFLLDYDVEIASSSAVFDPIVGEAAEGTRIQMRGVPSPDGIFLTVLLFESRVIGGLELQPVEARGSVWTEKGELTVGDGLAVQKVRTFSRSIAFDTFLASGKAAVFTSECRLADHESRELVVLRRLRGSLGAFASRQVPGTTRRLIAVNSELLGPPKTRIVGPQASDDEPHFRRDPRLIAHVRSEPSLFLFDWMKHRFSVWRRMGPWALAVSDPAWDDDAAAELQGLIAGWDPPAHVMNVDIRLHEAGGVPVRWQLPLRSGSGCGVRIGVTSVALVDYDVEVAQNAAVHDPTLMSIFEGLATGVATARGGSGALTLDVHAIAQVGRDKGTVDAAAPGLAAFDVPDLRRLEVDDRLGLVAQPEGAVQYRLGDTGQGGNNLQLEVVVR